MSTRTTVTLDDDVATGVKRESQLRGTSFSDSLNDLLKVALRNAENAPSRRTLKIKPARMGYKAGLNCDSIEHLIEYGEGEQHR